MHTTQSVSTTAATARQLSGSVVEVDAQRCLVAVPGALLDAQRALSCLVVPEVGDRVAVWAEEGGRAFVMAVLERAGSGALAIDSERDLSIRSAGELSLRGARLGLVAEQTQLLLGKLRLVAGELLAESRSVRLLTQVAHTVADSLHLVAQRSFRHVEHSDHQRCGHLDLQATQLVQIRARNTMITAEQLTRVDGAQIHVG